jgi:sugar phosphate isomerase/epimerase
MLIGTMNNPAGDLLREIQSVSELGMDFIDLTLEPPAASSWKINVPQIRKVLQEANLGIVGHTAFYLPIASPIEEVRRGAVMELVRCAQVFADLGAHWMNLHPDRHAPFHTRSFIIQQNLKSLNELLAATEGLGLGLMVENIPGDFNNAEQLGELLDPLPKLGLHLDIGHCNLLVKENTTEEIMRRFGNRLCHVHLHDNKGGQADLHMPLGTGTVDVEKHISLLKRSGYDSTITLEVFTPDKRHVVYSRDFLRALWDKDKPQPASVSAPMSPVASCC